mgnify:CR=1 FL=1
MSIEINQKNYYQNIDKNVFEYHINLIKKLIRNISINDKKFTEEFFPQIGTLGVHYLGKELALKPGEHFKVPILDVHRFYNPTALPIVFKARLEPGQPGFENFMAVLFGLVRDGKTFGKNQIPYNPFHAVLLLHWGDTQVDSFLFRGMRPVLSMFVSLSRKLGYEKSLLEKYKAS